MGNEHAEHIQDEKLRCNVQILDELVTAHFAIQEGVRALFADHENESFFVDMAHGQKVGISGSSRHSANSNVVADKDIEDCNEGTRSSRLLHRDVTKQREDIVSYIQFFTVTWSVATYMNLPVSHSRKRRRRKIESGDPSIVRSILISWIHWADTISTQN